MLKLYVFSHTIHSTVSSLAKSVPVGGSHKLKSTGVRWGDRGGHRSDSFRPIHQ
jgi:hypothetical protein